MKSLSVGIGWTAALAAGLLFTLNADPESSGRFNFDRLPLPAGGGECVEVQVTSNLIRMAARLVERHEPDIAQLLRGLESVHVNVVGLDSQNRSQVRARFEALRTDLEAQGWQRVVNVRQAQEDVGVYLKTRGEEAVEGVVVTVIEGDREAVLVNVVGDLRPEKFAEVGERLNIEPLRKLHLKAESKAAEAK